MRIKQIVSEKWSEKYKRSINCKNPKGFSQKAHCAGKKKNEQVELDEDLRKWFKEKWVRFGPDGKIRGSCARGSEGEGKPKCLPQSKAHSLGKKGRAKAARRKRREDPNPERKGKAKNVATKEGYSSGITGGSGLGITKSPIQKVLEKPLIEKKVDEAIDLKKLVSNPKKLKTNKTHVSPEEALKRLQKGQKDAYLINAIVKSPNHAFDYAYYVLRAPFPEGEPAIAKNAELAIEYARNILKGRFRLAEPLISKYADLSYDYAKSLNKRFIMGEPAIARDWYVSKLYMDTILGNSRFKIVEPYVARSPMHAYEYARQIGDRFKLGEPTIATDSYASLLYIKNILKGRFKLAEPTIAKEKLDSYSYAALLNSRFPLGEPKIATDAYLSYIYAKNIIKGRFKMGEPAIKENSKLWLNYKEFIHSLGKSNDIDEGQIYSTGGGPGESYRIMKPKHVDHYDDTSEGKVFKGLQREDEYSEGKVFKGLQRENVNTSPYNKTNKPPALSVLNTFIQVLNKPNNRYTPEYILDHYNRIYGMNYSVLTLKQVAKKIPYKLAELEDALAKGEQLYGSFTR